MAIVVKLITAPGKRGCTPINLLPRFTIVLFCRKKYVRNGHMIIIVNDIIVNRRLAVDDNCVHNNNRFLITRRSDTYFF